MEKFTQAIGLKRYALYVQDYGAPVGLRLALLAPELMTLLPADRSYCTFESSLTTPPCTEGVKWFVLKHPLELSAAGLARFARLYRHNERPPQPLNGRLISESAD